MATPANADRAVRITVDKKQVVAELVEQTEGGKEVTKERDRFNPDLSARRKALARQFGIEDGLLLHWIDEARRVATAGDARPQSFAIPRDDHPQGDMIVRRLDQRDAEGEVYPLDAVHAMDVLLPTVANDLILTWKDQEVLCCLDVDWHEPGRPAPHESWLRLRVTADLAPRPYAWHFSRRGGLHLFYIRSDPFTAAELAAAAALAWRRIDPTGGIELKTVVRGPGQLPVHYAPGRVQDTTALMQGWVERTAADIAQTEEWLDAQGMEVGRRYDHTKCPIYPTPGHASSGEPVTVGDQGIFCHNCAGQDRSLGCRRPGFAPYAKLIGGETAGDIGNMVKGLCHWGHAKYVLTRKYGMPEVLAKLAYSAALKLYHHGKERAALIPAVFAPATEQLCRLNDGWVNLDDGAKSFLRERLNTVIAELPAVLQPDETGKLKPRESAVTLLMQNHDLTERGIPPIETIWGFRLTKTHLADPANEPTKVELYPKELRRDNGRFLPRYVPASRRDVPLAWAAMETVFPGLDRNLINIVMCAIASAQETELGMHPMLFVEGNSGAAKSTTPRIAARILGTTPSDFVYKSDEYRWAQSMYEANKRGGLILLNELVKDTERGSRGRSISSTEPFDPLLNVTPDALVNVMHVGPRPYGRLGAFVMTEPRLNLDLRDEIQIARRIRHWRVDGLKQWDFARWGMDRLIGNLRMLTVPVGEKVVNMNEACDAIMSDLIDSHFLRPESWDEMAEAFGCKKISESEEFNDLTPYLREFFRLVCAAPDLKTQSTRLAKRYPNGYKKIERSIEGAQKDDDADPLTSVYSMFSDGRGSDWLKSRRLTEKDWGGILKVGEVVKLTLANDGSNVYARFHVGRQETPAKVNEQIIDPSGWEVMS